MTLVREVRPLAGSPRLRILLRPASQYGAKRPALTYGSNHVRYVAENYVMRVTTDCSITALVDELPFVLQRPLTFILGPDETLQGGVTETARRFHEETADYWRDWVRDLQIPFEWQDEIIRAALTLKLSAVDDTGALVAAVTTSIPEAAGSGRNWDYRYCWLRDAYFTVNALNRLNATRTMERYLGYIINLAAGADGARLQPVYRINGTRADGGARRRLAAGLPRHGAGARRQPGRAAGAERRLRLGRARRHARVLRPAPDAHRQRGALSRSSRRSASAPPRPGTSPTPACGSCAARRACTRSRASCAGRPATAWRRSARASAWRRAPRTGARAPTASTAASASARGARSAAASSPPSAARASTRACCCWRSSASFRRTIRATAPRVAAIERELKKGDFVFRYTEPDDFGVPSNAFLVCSFWFVDALAAVGRREEARALFESLLACRNRHGLLAEHVDPASARAVGQLPADLQHGRAGQLGDAAVDRLGPRLLMRLGVDVGGTKIEAAVLDGEGRIVARRRAPTPQGDYAAALRRAGRADARSSSASAASAAASAWAFRAGCRARSGLVENAYNTPFNGRPLRADLESALGRELRFANDANCFALSEAADGAARGARVVFGAILGTGAGGGVVAAGRVLEGRHGIAGEWGHNPLPWMRRDEFPGPRCTCGREGCIEQFVSGPALARETAARGEAAALARYEDCLARALAHVVNLIDPDVIVLGGGVSSLERLYASLPPLLPRYAYSAAVDTPVVRSAHGEASGVRGAAMLWDQP